MPSLKGTKTHQNLKEAFAGESQANRRYLYFAKVADVEGQPEIAGLFRDTAEGETGHAHGHLDYLKQVGDPATDLPIGDSLLNLKAAVHGETYEYTDMYPGMAKTAREEGFAEIADWFETLAKAEKSHAGRFGKAADTSEVIAPASTAPAACSAAGRRQSHRRVQRRTLTRRCIFASQHRRHCRKVSRMSRISSLPTDGLPTTPRSRSTGAARVSIRKSLASSTSATDAGCASTCARRFPRCSMRSIASTTPTFALLTAAEKAQASSTSATCARCARSDALTLPRDGHEFQLDFPRLMQRDKAVTREGIGRAVSRQDALAIPIASASSASLLPGLANFGCRNTLNRALMEKLLGIHRDKKLPEFAEQTFEKWLARKSAEAARRIRLRRSCCSRPASSTTTTPRPAKPR